MAKRIYGCVSLGFLIMGMGIYLFFRGLDMLLFEWIPKPAVLEGLYLPLPATAFTALIKYHAPDMLWFLSGICFLRCIWLGNNTWQTRYVYGFYGIGILFETAQLSSNIPGTFDPLDLLCMGICALLEGLVYKILL